MNKLSLKSMKSLKHLGSKLSKQPSVTGADDPSSTSSSAAAPTTSSASTPNVFGRETFDKLELAKNAEFAKFLKKNGDKAEKLVYSNIVTKINSKGKEQKRILIITDHAMYNVTLPTNMKKTTLGSMKRRIQLQQIHAVTISTVSDEFVLHAPNEYDYHYKSDEKYNISKIIEYILHAQNKDMQIVYVQQESLHELANADEKAAKKQTVNEKFEKYWQARNALKRNGIEQEEDGAQQQFETFDYKKLIAALKKQDGDNKYNLDIKSDTELFSDETMDPEILIATASENKYDDFSDDEEPDEQDEEDDELLIVSGNDYIEIQLNWMRFEKLMLDSNDGHQVVLCRHIINRRYYILNVTRKELLYQEPYSLHNKLKQFSLYKNIEAFKCRDYRMTNHLDFSLFRDDDKLQVINKSTTLELLDSNSGNANATAIDVDEEKENPLLPQKNRIDYQDHKAFVWNDKFTAKDYVVKKLDVVSTPNCIIEITEYFNSGDLSIHLQNKQRFTVKQCKYIIAQVVLAMHFLHEQMEYMVYDMKPENIYMDSNGYIGIAEIQSLQALKASMHNEANLNLRGGAPEYLSPEILNHDEQRLSVRSDFWSLGILTYELLVGLPPFFSDDMDVYDEYLEQEENICIQFMQKKMRMLSKQNKMVFPSEMEPVAQDFISKLLVVDPMRRLTDFESITQHPFFDMVSWDKLLYKAESVAFQPPVLTRFGKIKSVLAAQDWSGRKILDAWFLQQNESSAATATDRQQQDEIIASHLKCFQDQSAWKYFAKLENQI